MIVVDTTGTLHPKSSFIHYFVLFTSQKKYWTFIKWLRLYFIELTSNYCFNFLEDDNDDDEKIRKEIEWFIKDNCKTGFLIKNVNTDDVVGVYFILGSDAMAFKLRWL